MPVDPLDDSQPTYGSKLKVLVDELTALKTRINNLESRTVHTAVADVSLVLPAAGERALRVQGYDSTGAPVMLTRTDDGGAALALDLLDDTDAAAGAGMVGADLTLNYAAGTVGALLRECAVNVRGAPYYAGGVAVDDAAAIQAALDDNPSGAIYIPNPPDGARDYLLTSGLSIPTASTCWVLGDDTYIEVQGNITALTVTDASGVKGGIRGIHFYNSSNTYTAGGLVDFAVAPNSIGIKVRDAFQFKIIDCTVEQFGVGILLNNYAAWCEGTLLQNAWLRNNKVGWKCLREGSGTDSLSHTQAWGVKIQIPRDNTGGVPGNWCDGLVIDGNGVGALQIYNAFLNIHFWTGDSATSGHANSGNFVKLLNSGRIAGSFLTWTFERYGKVNIASSSYIDQPTCHIFMSALDSAQLEITDANAAGSKFRSFYIGNVNRNLNAHAAISNWRGSGNAATFAHGESYSSAVGNHFLTGSGIGCVTAVHLSGSMNGMFIGSTPDHEGNITYHSYIAERGAGFATLRLTGPAANPGHKKEAVTGAGPTTYTCAQGVGHFRLTGCVSPLTITLPSESFANDGQMIAVVCDAGVATLAWSSPSGADKSTLPVSATANVAIRAIYSHVDNAWYPA